jgi:hypothetical protein
LPYLFNGWYSSPPPTAERQVLAQRLIAYWSQFARTDNPNNDNSPPWAAFHPGGSVLSIKAGNDGIGFVNLATASLLNVVAVTGRSRRTALSDTRPWTHGSRRYSV